MAGKQYVTQYLFARATSTLPFPRYSDTPILRYQIFSWLLASEFWYKIPMRRSEKQVTNLKGIEAILCSGQICFLSMVDDGKPYIVPLNYGYDNHALYFHSAPEGRKIDIMKKNPDVSFCILAGYELVKGENPCSWSTKYSSVIGTGKARILTNLEDKKLGLTVLMGQHSEKKYDFTGMELDNVVIIKIDIEELEGKRSN
jgi:nitroimidazol reductase NimA-like FMN-containing flavoprotein (pyridoxamine 5'-phosphate oxidase superfamily)